MLRRRMAAEVPARRRAGVLPEMPHLLDYTRDRMLEEQVRVEVERDRAIEAAMYEQSQTRKEKRRLRRSAKFEKGGAGHGTGHAGEGLQFSGSEGFFAEVGDARTGRDDG